MREHDDGNAVPSAGSVVARTVRGASTVTASTRGYDGVKHISGREQFGVVDTNGMLLGVRVLPDVGMRAPTVQRY